MRVVITGASRGIGRATALKLAADGAEALTLCDVAYLDELEALATNLRTSGCKVRTLKADMARPSEPARAGGRRREGDGRHRCHRRQCRHHRTRQAGRSRHRDLGPHLRRQPQGQLAAGQGGPSASQAVEGCGRHAGLDGRHHAADPDRRLQPGQGGPRHADGNAGDGMGNRRHPRQLGVPGLRAHLDDRRDLSPVQAGARPRQAGAARPGRQAGRHRRRHRLPAEPAGELHHRPGAAGRWRAHALDPQPRAGRRRHARKAKESE